MGWSNATAGPEDEGARETRQRRRWSEEGTGAQSSGAGCRRHSYRRLSRRSGRPDRGGAGAAKSSPANAAATGGDAVARDAGQRLWRVC